VVFAFVAFVLYLFHVIVLGAPLSAVGPASPTVPPEVVEHFVEHMWQWSDKHGATTGAGGRGEGSGMWYDKPRCVCVWDCVYAYVFMYV